MTPEELESASKRRLGEDIDSWRQRQAVCAYARQERERADRAEAVLDATGAGACELERQRDELAARLKEAREALAAFLTSPTDEDSDKGWEALEAALADD